MILVDTNVLPDLVTNDPVWANWSIERLDAAALEGPVVINDVIYADVSIRFTTIEAVDTLLEEVGITLARLPRAALFSRQQGVWAIPRSVAPEPGCCRTFSSARMPPWRG